MSGFEVWLLALTKPSITDIVGSWLLQMTLPELKGGLASFTDEPSSDSFSIEMKMKRLPTLPSLYKPRAGLTQGLLTPAEWDALV